MSHEDKVTHDQAEQLRSLLSELENNDVQTSDYVQTEDLEQTTREVDVLNLPPRKEVHKDNNKMNLKVRRPFIRLVSVSLIVILIFTIILYNW